MAGAEKISHPFGIEQPATTASTDADGAATETHFKMPVDSDHKATEFWLFSFAKPHMRAFQLSWFSFFCCFVSTFAAPPLLPVIRDNLGLTATDIGNAGIASVSGAVFARLAMGTACDLVGPRLASASLTLITTPAVYYTSVISSANGFLLARFFTGFSLASFVSTQYWMSSMFSPPKVGIANGFAGGWGNLGGGATQLIMPLVYDVIHKIGSTNYTAWRIAFFIPGFMQTVSAILLLALGQDMPDGNFRKLRVLLRRRAHDRQHHCAVLLRPVQRQSPHRGDNRCQLRPRQHHFTARRGFALRLALRPVRDAGAVVGAVGDADPRRHLLHPAGQDGDTKRRHRRHDPLLPVRSGRLWPHLWCRPLHLGN